MKPTVSIIIVYYKVKKELFSCLQSIKNSKTKVRYEVIVVDNDEKSEIQKELYNKFPEVRYVKNLVNNGFGAGNNLGARHAKGEYFFFLNPDTQILSGATDKLYAFAKKTNALVAPLLLDLKKYPFPLQGSKKLTPLTAIIVYSFFNKFFPNNLISKKFWLKDWDKTFPLKVDAVPGTAFMIRKEIFNKIGGFDEKFFLYFEEYDLAKRVQSLSISLYMVPQAKIIHAWGKSTEKSSLNIKKIFLQSRFYYFRKHFGLIPALITEGFLRISKEDIVFLIFFLLGIFLRFFNLSARFYFDGEIGDNLLDIKNLIIHHTLPLLGPPTSHPWLYFGPLYYWLYTPVLYLSNFNPVSYAYFGSIFNTLIIFVNYVFIQKLFNKKVALISSFLIATSPLFLFFSYVSRFFSLVPIFVYPFLYTLYNIPEKKKFFLLGLVLGIMLNFHYTPLVLIPTVIFYLLYRKVKVGINDIARALLGLVIPLFPVLLYDSMHKFSMTLSLFLWIPYRILGFLGLYHKNALSVKVLQENTLSFTSFFSESVLHSTYIFTGYLLIILTFFFSVWILKKQKNLKTSPIVLILAWGIIGLAAIFVHGNPPNHYFVPILSFPIIVYSLFLGSMWKKKFGKIIVFGVLIACTLLNFFYYFSSQWFYNYKTSPRSYEKQVKAAKTIIADAHGQKFKLKRVGFNDQFAKNYAQNFIYLLWRFGNEPISSAKLQYTIYDSVNYLPTLKKNEVIFPIAKGLAIIKQHT